MGQITKLSESFTNSNLPTLIDYDPAQVKAEILRLPSLRAFHDFTDSSQITMDGSNLVGQVNDQSGNGLHWTASANKPTFTAGAMNGVADGVVFDGLATRMQCAGLFSGATRFTIAAAFYASGADGSSRVIISDDANNNLNMYTTSVLVLYGNDVNLSATNLTTEIHYAIGCVDTIAGTVSLYGRDGSASDVTTKDPASGDATLGAHDVLSNYFDGAMGTMMVFDETLSQNDVGRAMVIDYFTRKFRVT